MSTAFVTGGSGFIGGRLTERLVADGSHVRALARSDRSAAAVEAFRGSGPSDDQGAAIRSAAVFQHEVASSEAL